MIVFFSTWVTNPFNNFKFKKKFSFVGSLKIQDIVNYPQCYATKGLLFKCQKCYSLKSYFNFYLLIPYLYNAVKGDMDGWDASEIEGLHGMLMGIKALVHQIMY